MKCQNDKRALEGERGGREGEGGGGGGGGDSFFVVVKEMIVSRLYIEAPNPVKGGSSGV